MNLPVQTQSGRAKPYPLSSLHVLVALACLLLSGCAANTGVEQIQVTLNSATEDNRDPLETVNRGLWNFNWNVLDRYLLRPTTVAYTTLSPGFARTGLRNAVRNLEEPSNSVNSFLQGKGEKGLDGLSRFLINSTLGVFGLVDVASTMGIQRQVEDLDETLAVWDVDGGPFLMVPILGPNDSRGLFGDIIDNTSFPYSALNTPLNVTRFVLNAIENRAALIAQEEQIVQSLDEYSFVKTAFFQNKAFTINDGVIEDEPADAEEAEDFEAFEAYLEEGGR